MTAWLAMFFSGMTQFNLFGCFMSAHNGPGDGEWQQPSYWTTVDYCKTSQLPTQLASSTFGNRNRQRTIVHFKLLRKNRSEGCNIIAAGELWHDRMMYRMLYRWLWQNIICLEAYFHKRNMLYRCSGQNRIMLNSRLRQNKIITYSWLWQKTILCGTT